MPKPSVFAGRQVPPNKLVILGAASAMEDATKRISQAAQVLRMELQASTPTDLASSYNCRSDFIEKQLNTIQANLDGLQSLFDQMAGVPNEKATVESVRESLSNHPSRTIGREATPLGDYILLGPVFEALETLKKQH